MQKRWPFRGGFTLVELLVVIGIIAVLISILLPALNKAKDAANTIACGSNMRQMGIASQMYINDFKCYPPAGFIFNASTGSRRLTWDRLLAGYLGGHVPLEYDALAGASKKFGTSSMAVYTCPSDSFGFRYQSATLIYPNEWRQSYSAARAFWNGATGWPFNHKGKTDPSNSFHYYPTLSLMDWGDDTSTGGADSSKGKQLIKYMSFVKPSQVAKLSTCLLIVERMTPNNVQGDDAAIYCPNAGWENDDADGGKEYPLNHMHGTKMNYLFGDGHVEPLRPIDTVAPASSWKPTRGINDADGMWMRKDAQLY